MTAKETEKLKFIQALLEKSILQISTCEVRNDLTLCNIWVLELIIENNEKEN